MKTKDKEKNKKRFPKKPFLIGVAVIVGLVLMFALYSVTFANRIYLNTYIAGEKYSGLKKDEAKEKLKAKLESGKIETMVLAYENIEEIILPAEINYQPNPEATIENVFKIGRRTSFFTSLKEQFKSIITLNDQEVVASYDTEKLNAKLNDLAKKIDIELKTITFELKNDQIILNPSHKGQKVNQDETKKAFFLALNNFKDKTSAVVDKIEPKVKEDQIDEAKIQFETLVFSPLTLSWENQTYNLSPNDLQNWANFTEKEKDGIFVLEMALNKEKIKAYLNDLGTKINKEAVDARLTISGGAATVFQPHQDGYQFNEEETQNKIEAALQDKVSDRKIKLSVKLLRPNVRTDNLNELGIKELIAEGTTSFKGSPKNRITNITIGANLFNGVLIKPGEEFSFNKVLGEVSAKRGFLPELVIKEDRLIPETGGGLCQVSTTMFRAAINSGLDITARTPHSFRVRYYEPPVGLDATVYQPNPDLKFKNDTSAYIIIQTVISGSKLTFQFYGTKDGRTVEIKGPFTSDSRSPGPATYIDDPSLPTGVVKQIEKAVPGMTATVNWTVYKDGKVLHQKTFVSKYVAWSAKYKRGTGGAAPAPPPVEQPAPAPEPTPTPVQEPIIPPEGKCNNNGEQDDNETGIDCGGDTCPACPPPTP